MDMEDVATGSCEEAEGAECPSSTEIPRTVHSAMAGEDAGCPDGTEIHRTVHSAMAGEDAGCPNGTKIPRTVHSAMAGEDAGCSDGTEIPRTVHSAMAGEDAGCPDGTEISRTVHSAMAGEDAGCHQSTEETETAHSVVSYVAGKGAGHHPSPKGVDTVRSVVDYNKRLVHTAVFCFGFLVFGWVVGQRGAIFLDLLIITATDMAEGSVLFTLAGLASIGGTLVGGFALDWGGRPLMMMAAVFAVNAALNSTLALCEPLALMAAVYFLSHFTLSVYDVGCHHLPGPKPAVTLQVLFDGRGFAHPGLHLEEVDVTVCWTVQNNHSQADDHANVLQVEVAGCSLLSAKGQAKRARKWVVNPHLASLWPGAHSGQFLQALHFSFSVGAVLSPLATQPFLAPRPVETHLHPVSHTDRHLQDHLHPVNLTDRHLQDHLHPVNLTDRHLQDHLHPVNLTDRHLQDHLHPANHTDRHLQDHLHPVNHTDRHLQDHLHPVNLTDRHLQDHLHPVNLTDRHLQDHLHPVNLTDRHLQDHLHPVNLTDRHLQDHLHPVNLTDRHLQDHLHPVNHTDRQQDHLHPVNLTDRHLQDHRYQSGTRAYEDNSYNGSSFIADGNGGFRAFFENSTYNHSSNPVTAGLPGEREKSTRVLYALLISGCLCLMVALLIVILMVLPVQKLKAEERLKAERRIPAKGKKVYLAALLMVGVYNFLGSSVEDVFPLYLMTFVVRHLHWSKRWGAEVTSVYWVGLAVGRLGGVGLVKVLSPARIIVLCLSAMMMSLLVMLVASIVRVHWAVWLGAAAVGLSTSVLFPTGLTYVHQQVSPLTGRVSALVFTTPMVAAMVNPVLLAALMTRLHDLAYLLLFLLQTALALVSFLTLHTLARHLNRHRQDAVTAAAAAADDNDDVTVREKLMQKEEGSGTDAVHS